MRESLLGEPARFANMDADSGSYGEWPAGDYLLRMAGSDDPTTRKGVIAALQSVAGAFHSAVLEKGIAILAALPPDEAASNVDLAIGWLSRNSSDSYALAPTDLIKRLSEAGKGEAALKIARVVFRLWAEDGHIKSRFGLHMYEHHLSLLRGSLTAACGLKTLELLVDCLCQAFTIEGESSHGHVPLAPVYGTKYPPFGVIEAPIDSVFETATEIVFERPLATSDVIGALAISEERTFARISMHVLAQSPSSAPDLATAYLLNANFSTHDWCNQEYAALAMAWFPSLSEVEQTAILRTIDSVPEQYLEWWKTRFEQQHHTPPSPEDTLKFVAGCKSELLWR